ncbi:unnamed protein product, partial [Ranitomeya imitator]
TQTNGLDFQKQPVPVGPAISSAQAQAFLGHLHQVQLAGTSLQAAAQSLNVQGDCLSILTDLWVTDCVTHHHHRTSCNPTIMATIKKEQNGSGVTPLQKYTHPSNESLTKFKEEPGEPPQAVQPSQQPSLQAAIPQTQLMVAGGQITGFLFCVVE